MNNQDEKTLKDTLKEAFESSKSFCKRHKLEIALGATVLVFGSGIIVLSYKYGQLEKLYTISCANEQKLQSIISNKNTVIKNLEKTISTKDIRIQELTELCNNKDSHYVEAISELLRKGSSLGGQQMAYKRWS